MSLANRLQVSLLLLFCALFAGVSVCRAGPVVSAPVARGEIVRYLDQHPRVRGQITLETDRPKGSEQGVWLAYDHWATAWKTRLADCYVAFRTGGRLPLAGALPLSGTDEITDVSLRAYRSVELARDTYFAQVAHALWLDIAGKVPWKLDEWSNHELSYLLSSKVCFTARRSFRKNELYYVVFSSESGTENILSDPRLVFAFMQGEPEQGTCLIGGTPSETGQRLSAWFHDYLWHAPSVDRFDAHAFMRQHPLLTDRLRRHTAPARENVYLAAVGCWSASSLFADLMRSVNIPVRKVVNEIVSPGGAKERHCGLMFDWQGTDGKSRYLLHTDSLYLGSYFKDPAPAPKGAGRGVALWDHVWLDATRFGNFFTYDHGSEFFARATFAQDEKYWVIGDWMVCSAQAVKSARYHGTPEKAVDFLQRERTLTRAEAEACWRAVEASVLSYGDGDMDRGYQRLLDGPNSRHGQWCRRTGKSVVENVQQDAGSGAAAKDPESGSGATKRPWRLPRWTRPLRQP